MSSFAAITPRHMELLAAVVKNLKTADVDWETVAADANYKTAKYARDEYARTWKKLQTAAAPNKDKDDSDAAENGALAATPITPATPKTKKRKAAGEKTPAKGKKAKKSEAAVEGAEDEVHKVKPEPEGDNGEGEDMEVRDEDTLF